MNWDTIGLYAGIALPMFDIPLIIHIIKRKSSADISLVWMWGIWLSSVLMAPSAWFAAQKNIAAIGFNIANVTALTILLIVVVKYRKGNTDNV